MKWRLGWPRTLASQLSLIFLISLVCAHGLSFSAQFYERYISARTAMLGNLENDVSTSVAILDRLPANERASWLPRIDRQNYHYLLNAGETGEPMSSDDVPMAATSIADALGEQYALTFRTIPGLQKHFQAHLTLADGNPITLDVRPAALPVAYWLPVVLILQLALLLGCTWLAVRLAIRPLTRLARAVETLDPNAHPSPSPWRGLAPADRVRRDRLLGLGRAAGPRRARLSARQREPLTNSTRRPSGSRTVGQATISTGRKKAAAIPRTRSSCCRSFSPK